MKFTAQQADLFLSTYWKGLCRRNFYPAPLKYRYSLLTVCARSEFWVQDRQAHFSSLKVHISKDSADISQLNGIFCHYTMFTKVYCSGVKCVPHCTDLALFENMIAAGEKPPNIVRGKHK